MLDRGNDRAGKDTYIEHQWDAGWALASCIIQSILFLLRYYKHQLNFLNKIIKLCAVQIQCNLKYSSTDHKY